MVQGGGDLRGLREGRGGRGATRGGVSMWETR